MNQSYQIVGFLLQIWSVFWVGLSLWKAARFEQRWWFIANLIFGFFSAGLLSIVYLFWFSKKRFSMREIKDWNWQLWKKSSRTDNK